MNRKPNTQDLSWFLDLKNKNQLELDPPYQRKSVWTTDERKFFLDTIFRNYPCPAIFLHKAIDDKGNITYNVVDGKQRLLTLLMFANDELSIANEFGDTSLDGKKFSELSKEYRNIFWNYVFTVEYIDDIDAAVVNEIFDRVNRNSKKLERQELRHAKYAGWFASEAEMETDKPEWKDLGISTTTSARRMRDIQLVSELLLVILDNGIVGFNQDYLDTKYAEYDNPTAEHVDFSEENYKVKKEFVKKTILDLERTTNSITKFAKTANHFYTLWAFISLHEQYKSDKFAKKYLKFMEQVKEIAKEKNIDHALKKDKKGEYEQAYVYYQNSIGANTDLAPRKKRLEILNSVLSS